MAARRVLHFCPSLSGAGAETQLGYLCRSLVSRGWEVHVALLTGGPNLHLYEESGATLHWISHRGNYDARILWRALRLTRRLDPDLLQTWIPMMDILGGLAALGAGVPWILSERSSPGMFPTSMKFRIRARMARHATAVVSNSAGGDAYWAERLPASVRRYVIGNALPFDAIDATPRAAAAGFGLEDARPLVLYVGRITELKNIGILLDSLACVVQETDAVALLCGIGTQLEEARRWVSQRGLEHRIALPGFVGGIVPLLKRAAVFVSLSTYEGMPNAVMEAMAAGCPIVASDIPAHREILDARSALLVPVDDVDAAVAALVRVLRCPDEAVKRVAAARGRASGWTPDAICDRYEALYAETVASRDGR